MYHINSMVIEGKLKDRPTGERFIIESKKNKDILVSVPCIVKKESLHPILNILREGMKVRVLGWFNGKEMVVVKIETNIPKGNEA